MNNETNKLQLTILVNSCDAYEELWDPFFTLLSKYWNSIDVPIILNTESKDYSYNGLDIDCVHPGKSDTAYGARLLNALKHIKTKYVLFLLDDFFIRQEVDVNKIKQIIQWMDSDNKIAMFTCNTTKTYYDWEVNRYDGYKRVPYGNSYTLTMQAGIWNVDKLKKYWRENVSPWEWEEYGNQLTTFFPNDEFYACIDPKFRFCEYGYNGKWMGVYHGRWVIEDVKPLFEKERIEVDFNNLGTYKYEEGLTHLKNEPVELNEDDLIQRCLGIRGIIGNYFFKKLYRLLTVLYEPYQGGYFGFLEHRAKVRFCKKHNLDLVHIVTINEVVKRLKNSVFRF